MKLSIIIVSFNTSKLTCQTLKSVFADLKKNPELARDTDIWLVDNASTDNTLEQAKMQFASYLASSAKPRLNIIANTKNVGFSGANNQALRKSQADIVLLLNSDTVVHPGALQKVVNAFAQPTNSQTAYLAQASKAIDNLGIVSCSLWNPDGSEQAQGGSLPSLLALSSHWLFLDDIPLLGKFLPSTQHTGRNVRQFDDSDTDQILFADWVGGTAMGLRKAMLDEIGLLDEAIFMYGEDVELCLRAKNHHWDVGILPAAKVTHYGSASSTSANAILGEIKGYLYIWSKHKPGWQLRFARAIMTLGCWLRWQLFRAFGKPQKSHIYHQALVDVLR